MKAAMAWTQQGWIAAGDAQLALDDWGVLQGAIAVDRLRTCIRTPLDCSEHIDRFRQSCDALRIQLPAKIDLESLIHECAERSIPAELPTDISIVLLATPGRISESVGCTLIVQPSPIRWSKLDAWFQAGQPLHVAQHRNVPGDCWSPAIKTRARLQYYLADQAATARDPLSAAVLLDLQGHLTETSTANLWIVENGALLSPQLHCILPGISHRRTERLARLAGMEVRQEPITPERAREASEILLCGSVGCLWPAASLGEKVFSERRVYQRLRDLWIEDIGLDFVAQAMQLAHELH